MLRRFAILLLLPLPLALPLASVGAQDVVGYPPERSPFRDIEFRHELTLFGGYFAAGKDPAGIAPRSAPAIGARYEANVGGPVSLLARVSYVRSERLVIDPTQSDATRSLGDRSWPLLIADVGIGVSLTGRKSYHRLVPVINLGFGFVSDLNQKVEEDPFTMGTTFAFNYGAGIRYVPGGRYQLRFSLDNYAYRLSYPPGYYQAPTTGDPVVPQSQKSSFWKNNTAFTLGGSVLLFR